MYCVATKDQEEQEYPVVKLRKIKFNQIPDYDFIIFKRPDDPLWVLSECSSGLRITADTTIKNIKFFVNLSANKIIKSLDALKAVDFQCRLIPIVEVDKG